MLKILITALLMMMLNPSFAQEKASEKRLDDVAQRGRHVMPFKLEQTLHIFSKTKSGGIQQVRVKNPEHTEQIKLIRKHLAKIADEFRQGQFTDPEKIHGTDMPGLASLRKARDDQLKISYQELPDGAEIIYSASNPELITAIHQFFDAQLSDHARHAISGHAMHQMHHP